jgi:hypothetical protein
LRCTAGHFGEVRGRYWADDRSNPRSDPIAREHRHPDGLAYNCQTAVIHHKQADYSQAFKEANEEATVIINFE